MAHHKHTLSTLHNLAMNLRAIIGQCYHCAGQYVLFERFAPKLATTYVRYNDLDWLRYTRNEEQIKKLSSTGYVKVPIPGIANNELFEINILSWLPDACTPVHMHPKYLGSSTTVLSGSLEESIYIEQKYDKKNSYLAVDELRYLEMEDTSVISGDIPHSIYCNDESITHSLQISLRNTHLYITAITNGGEAYDLMIEELAAKNMSRK